MQYVTLKIGECFASKHERMLRCTGLGSCVGVFVYDRVTKIGGGAHVFLPSTNFNKKQYSFSLCNDLLDALMQRMESLGANLKGVTAKVTGGAKLMQQLKSLGEQNTSDVLKYFMNKGIYVAVNDTGGKESRSVFFNTYVGDVEVKTPTKKYLL